MFWSLIVVRSVRLFWLKPVTIVLYSAVFVEWLLLRPWDIVCDV